MYCSISLYEEFRVRMSSHSPIYDLSKVHVMTHSYLLSLHLIMSQRPRTTSSWLTPKPYCPKRAEMQLMSSREVFAVQDVIL